MAPHKTFMASSSIATAGEIGEKGKGGPPFIIDFKENHENISRSLDAYVGGSFTVDPSIVDWARRVRPQHRCKMEIFKSMLLHGTVISSTQMEALARVEGAKRELSAHPRLADFAKESAKTQKTDPSITEKSFLAFAEAVVDKVYGLPANPKFQQLKSACSALLAGCQNHSVADLEKFAVDLANASKELGAKFASMGIHYEVDKQMKTNETVFSILGPHTGHYYGCIILIFKRDIMAHADFSTTCCAGTGYASGNAKKLKWKKLAWPSSGDKEENPERQERIKSYHNQKITGALPEYYELIAKELAACTGKGKDATREDVQALYSYSGVDSHDVFEGHLPAVCPFSEVAKIIVRDKLPPPTSFFFLLTRSKGGRRTPSVSSRVGSTLPLPLYADVRLHIPMTHRNDVGTKV